MFHPLREITDTGARLMDDAYSGDLPLVISRAWSHGLHRIVIQATSLDTAKAGIKIARSDEQKRMYCTVGCEPVNSHRMYKRKSYAGALSNLIERKSRVVAVGECGLDFRADALQTATVEMQLQCFRWQVEMAKYYELPLVMTCHGDGGFEALISGLARYDLRGGVVQSFTGTASQARHLAKKGFYIGINGCSLHTAQGRSMVKEVPLHRLVVSSGAPHCTLSPPYPVLRHVRTRFARNSSKSALAREGLVAGRVEPIHVIQVLEAVAGLRRMDADELAEIMAGNVQKLFFYKPKVRTGLLGIHRPL